MKTPQALICAIVATFAAAAHAVEKSPAASAYQASVAQDQVRKQTQRIREELRALLVEFQSNSVAGKELTQGKAILDQLDTLSDKEMLEVVKTLRDASRAPDVAGANAQLASAGTRQKSIQSALQTIADRLTAQKDEASMRQRLRELAVRQTSAQRQGELMASRWTEPGIIAIAQAEQTAIKDEVDSALETLQRLSRARSQSAAAFAAAYSIAATGRLSDQVGLATSETAASHFAEAVNPQSQVVAVLRQMIDGLNKTRTPQERMRELATRMKELASDQKQLADSTQKSYVGAQAEIAKRQADIADELSILKEEVKQMSPQAGAKAEAAQSQTDFLSDRLAQDRTLIDKVEGKQDVIQQQKNAAENIASVANDLKAMERQMAGSGKDSSSQGSASSDPQFAAIQDAANKVMEAKSQLAQAQANSQAHKGGEAQAKLDAASQALADAEKSAAQAGDSVGKDVGENLEGAQNDAKQGKEQQGAGNEMMAGHNINEAQKKADAALAGLQKAANALAGANGAPPPGHGDGMELGKGGAGPLNGGTGNPTGGGALLTDVSATSGISPAERAALSLLQREKPPVEYNEMVRQYLKNLAEGEMPGQ
ncbi:MAG: hypothetical protein BGO12_09340 [Verrucomicrobia bacterium 61-8]|nr:hypothetical protein [Verrucomicrobiota bacterium]OJV25305.1 MAG: hypothetical protein BGO12_09340 [Verrucomicrobia bacterium 61-8]